MTDRTTDAPNSPGTDLVRDLVLTFLDAETEA